MQVFSHPEAQMGFHPDAGASFYLSRLPGYLGDITFMPFALSFFSTHLGSSIYFTF